MILGAACSGATDEDASVHRTVVRAAGPTVPESVRTAPESPAAEPTDANPVQGAALADEACEPGELCLTITASESIGNELRLMLYATESDDWPQGFRDLPTPGWVFEERPAVPEVAHWGDPAFDVGFATAHVLGKANHLAGRRAEFRAAAQLFWATYADIVGDLPWFMEAAERAVGHSIACVLARVCGKSPLEYLSDGERQRQQVAALDLIADRPPTYDDLVGRFLGRLDR